MDLGIAGKVALVTGSTAGIGRAIALTLAREGTSVIVNGRTKARVDDAVREIQKEAGANARVRGIAADVGTAAGAESLAREAGSVDILINNAGIFEPKPFFEIPDRDWMRFYEVNVMSGVRLSRALMPGMLKRNWGRIVFISSESGFQIPSEMIHYGMTKTAQIAIARGLAETTAGTNVTVNSVLPGPTWSEGVETFVDQLGKAQNMDRNAMEKAFFEKARPTSLLKRFITVDEVAAMVAYVCSTAAGATNGASLRVDGGVIRAI
jgi:NAD(P)-dependent dehydrogenase (short-subunit alcohol dehydrogenase family)